MMSTICIIPARGGSKGILRKNVRMFDQKPLLAHTIEDALESRQVDGTYVSTEDAEIAAVARKYGAEVIHRPADLATDDASSESVVNHALSMLEPKLGMIEWIVLLQCTSPFRSGRDIDRALDQLRVERADSLFSVSPSHRFLWEKKDGNPHPINYDPRHRPMRQQMRQYFENGSIFIFRPSILKEQGNRLGGRVTMFIMSEEAGMDIDTPLDWQVAESLLQIQRGRAQ